MTEEYNSAAVNHRAGSDPSAESASESSRNQQQQQQQHQDHQDQSQHQQQQNQQQTPFKFTRSYKACLTCRKRKAKCDTGENDSPPCLRCRRERRECIFEAERSWNKKRKPDSDANVTIYRDDPADRDSSSIGGAGGPVAKSNSTFYAVGRGAPGRESTSSTSPSNHQGHVDPPRDLTQSLIKTVLANGSDALTLLSQAAVQQSTGEKDSLDASPRGFGSHEHGADRPSGNRHMSYGTAATPTTSPPKPVSPETYRLWKSCKFVKMGWLSAEDAIRYIDLFFENMAPQSPCVDDFYADHANHHHLLTQEPLLCCVILVMSSRYHALTGSGGATRGYFAHERLWKYFQHLLMQLVLGQEHETGPKLRTLGSIAALTLATEWHARGLYFPPEADGWDSDLIASSSDGEEMGKTNHEASQWLKTVIESVRRSDRMSWMFVGSALSLAHELNVFSDEEDVRPSIKPPGKHRIKRLLYLFVNQLASRLGCTSTMTQNVDSKNLRTDRPDSIANRQDAFMEGWIELTKLLRSLGGIVFPSKSVTQQLVQSGRYVSIVEHFTPLLLQWRKHYLDDSGYDDILQAQLYVEYQYVRIFCNSIGMQAVGERAGSTSDSGQPAPLSVDDGDRRYIEEVVIGSCKLLEKVTVAFGSTFRYAPVRIILRVVSGSMFLIKALAIGARQSHLRNAIDILERTVQTLRCDVLDDMHLADRFASLLEMHLGQIRKGSADAQAKQQQQQAIASGQATRQGSTDPNTTAPMVVQTQPARYDSNTFQGDEYAEMASWADYSLTDPFVEGFFSMPVNPTLTSLLYAGSMNAQWPQQQQ